MPKPQTPRGLKSSRNLRSGASARRMDGLFELISGERKKDMTYGRPRRFSELVYPYVNRYAFYEDVYV